MPLGNKALKKRQQAEDAKNGVIRNETEKQKLAKKKPEEKCLICLQIMTITKTNTEIRNHVSSRHPTQTMMQCFPTVATSDEAQAKAAAEPASGGGASGGAKKKTAAPKKKKGNADADLDMLMAGLSAAPKKKGGK